MESPCIKTCQIKDNVCIGCKRTLEEIANWLKYTDQQRSIIIEQLKHRT
jgi:uncharacterized protein